MSSEITKVFRVPEGTWVWCLHCERCYKVGEYRMKNDYLQMCHYEDCNGDAVIDAWKWNGIREFHPSYPVVPDRGERYPFIS